MVKVDDAVIAKLKVDGKIYEILVDCDKAMELKHGKQVSMRDVLAIDEIFTNSRKGDKPSNPDLKHKFKTDDVDIIAKKIILDGEIQLTSEYRKRLADEKYNTIIEMIRRDAIDPKTKLPHPKQRIINAIEEAKIRIDDHKSAKDQIDDIVKKIRVILPIKIATAQIKTIIPVEYVAKSMNTLKGFGTIKKEDWQNDGSLILVIDMPAGLNEEFTNKVNNLTKGSAFIEIISID